MSEALDHMAARVAGDPFFLAHPLAEYARMEKLDDAGLAAATGCRAEDLIPLRLCRAPRSDSAEFRADVTAIAGRFGIVPTTLAAVLQRVRGLSQLRGERTEAEPGHMIAARDDDRPPPDPGAPA